MADSRSFLSSVIARKMRDDTQENNRVEPVIVPSGADIPAPDAVLRGRGEGTKRKKKDASEAVSKRQKGVEVT